MAIVAIDQEDFRTCFLWLIVCFVIDALDGTFARMAKVEEVLPSMDGKTIDFVIDFASYALIPAYFFYKAEMASPLMMMPALAIILLSSALYYGKKGMVEDDQYFIGFPVLWNFVVFYQYFIFHNNQTLNIISVVFFGILHFVPLKFAYPSRTKRFFWSHLLFSLFGVGGALYGLIEYPDYHPWTDICAMVGAMYFSLFAIADTFRKSTS